jgi:hypothetical protein
MDIPILSNFKIQEKEEMGGQRIESSTSQLTDYLRLDLRITVRNTAIIARTPVIKKARE